MKDSKFTPDDQYIIPDAVKNDDVAMFAPEEMLLLYSHFYDKGRDEFIEALKQAKEACDLRLLGLLRVCKDAFRNSKYSAVVNEISEHEDRIVKAMEAINKALGE